MNKLSYLICVGLLATSTILTGCATTKTVDFKATTVQRPHLILPTADQILQDPIRWYAIAKKAPPGQKGSIEYFWQEMEKQGLTTGLVLSPSEYRKLARNTAKLQQYILQQKAIIKAYKRYYEENK